MYRHTVIFTLSILLILCAFSSAETESITISENKLSKFESRATRPNISAERLEAKQAMKELSLDLLPDTPDKYPSDPGLFHPAVSDALNDTLLLGYEYTDGIQPGYIYWHYSTDNGANWSTCCYHDLAGAEYPSLDYRGFGSYITGTFVPPISWGGGSVFMLLRFPDPTNPLTWSGSFVSWAESGFYNLKMADIASDDGQQSWNWGFISGVISRNYDTYVYDDIPIIFYQINDLGFTYITWYKDYEGCATTAATIDRAAGRALSVYDRYNSTTDQWELFALSHNFGDWDEEGLYFVKDFIDPDMNVIEPDIAAYDNNIVVVATAYDASDPADKDIFCWYTDNPAFVNFGGFSFIAATTDSETHPRVSHIGGSEFVCTFTRGDTLMVSYTCDNGATWTEPIMESVSGDEITAEYRNADISHGGKFSAYEFMGTSENDIAVEDLEPPDSDGDGYTDACDNCPDVSNSSQTDTDVDNIGDACDNCPDDYNYNQADGDGDGIGDVCDACPNDPENDPDGDNVCSDIDNCPDLANTTQDDADSDGVGDICDNCPDDYNPGQYNNDADALGDACDDDDDNDTILDVDDNCPFNYNPLQEDGDGDGTGDACEYICGDIDCDGDINLLDILYLIDFIYGTPPGPQPCPVLEAGNIDGDTDINLLDILYLIDFIYGVPAGPAPIC